LKSCQHISPKAHFANKGKNTRFANEALLTECGFLALLAKYVIGEICEDN